LLVAALTACGSGSSTGTAEAPAGAKENATTGTQCIPNEPNGVPTSACQVGMIGPGGGLVFYAKEGRFLEVAPWNWNLEFAGTGSVACNTSCSADPNSQLKPESNKTQDRGTGTGLALCGSPNQSISQLFWVDSVKAVDKPSLGTAIGAGLANTKALLADPACTGGAVRLVAEYRGGGRDDWFLPSKDELNELFTYGGRAAVGGFESDRYYFSSSVVSSTDITTQPTTQGVMKQLPGQGLVWRQKFGSGSVDVTNSLQARTTWNGIVHARPIRSFS
jgi:hypothetical protein